VKLAREVGDIRSLANLDGTLAHAYAIKGESILAIEHAEECFQGAQKIQNLDLMAPVARDLTSAYMFAGELKKTVPIFSTVIPLIEKANKRSESFGRPASVYTFLCGLAGFIMGFLGSFNEAEKLCEKALINALQNNDIYELAYSEFSYGIAVAQKGDGQPTVEHLQKCVDYLEQSQMTTLMDPALASLGLGYIYLGELEKARKYADRAIVAACQPGAAAGNALLTQLLLAMVYSEVGDLEKAHSCATEAVKLSEGRMIGAWEGLTHFTLGLVLTRIGKEEIAEAQRYIERSLIILDEYRLRPWLANGILTLGEIYASSGRSKEAREALSKAAGMFRKMGMEYWLTRTLKVLGRL
jgi:tetratricopeptide (TPR) repeat protein